ncbi:Nucleotide-binding universal stress protein, UspA family [Natronoarchaeum philippinense]|uniref:Nucleotide-binding universal stress protein, UspA family n=1 Tax=Natronoarchaeum philippinense TaxID=558529 RepID=A0A285P4Z9_NATPI|nr:universal stress protein [Natronoarchaeum philippinense]SNZ15236.1 Nucleotide-binding universal stress protein, UspA family [Natronoarchaeum philippinense]
MSRVIDSMLLPTDGSEDALTGAKHGIALASLTGADVHVLSVEEGAAATNAVETDADLPALEAHAEAAVETVAEMAREFDETIEVTTAVRSGTPFQTIREYAHRRGVDAIAMGTKGRRGLEEVLLGSVTENVLRTARTPVLAVPPEADAAIGDVTFERFLLPTDGSEGAAIAIEWGIALAARLEASVHALYSVDTVPFLGEQAPGELPDVLEERGQAAIEGVRERAGDAGIDSSGSTAAGSPVEVIPDAASDRDVDLIVMGTHGRTGVGQWFLGSVTENVVRQTDVPVLCVPVSAAPP